jgi:NTE family protein
VEKIALEKFPAKKSIFSLLDMVLPKSGLINGAKIISFLKSIIGDPMFMDLKIPFAVVSSELETGNHVIFRSGSVLNAVRASISFPGIFEPYKLNGKFLVDGAITEPVPVRALKQLGANKIIAVDVIPERNKTIRMDNPKVFDVVFRIMEIMESEIAQKSTEGADVVIKPEIESFGSLDFHKVADIIKAGEIAAENSIPFLKALLKK